MSNLFWLIDAQMERLCPFFPKSHGRPRVDDFRVLSDIIFININYLKWCEAPTEYGPANTLYNGRETIPNLASAFGMGPTSIYMTVSDWGPKHGFPYLQRERGWRTT